MKKYVVNKNNRASFDLSGSSPGALLPGYPSQFSLRLSLEVLIYWPMSDP